MLVLVSESLPVLGERQERNSGMEIQQSSLWWLVLKGGEWPTGGKIAGGEATLH